MVPGKIAITGMIVLAVCIGCTKKKTDKDKEFASSTNTATATTPAASQDIFDEFYKEDTSAAQKSGRKAKTEPVVRSGSTPSFSENGRYVVQVATHPSRPLAERLSSKLSAKGYPSYVAEVQNPTPALSGTFYRVRIGGFDGISAARNFGENTLVAEGYEYWVDKRSNDNVGLEGYGMGSGGSSGYSTESQPAYDYQSSTTPYETPPAATTTAPAGDYTPQPATTEPASTPPPPPPPPAATPAGSSTSSEWGNSDW